VAVFTLAVQVAAAAHSPALHEEPVSKCRDAGAHFCAEVVEQETGPCVLCQVSLNGVYLERVGAVQTLALAESVSISSISSLDLAVVLSSHAPRGPPVG
jgi:hypothetical protein